MFIHRVPKKNKNKIFTSYLLRETFRVKNKVIHRTIANITSWPEQLRNDLDKLLKGGTVTEKIMSFKQGKSYGGIKVVNEICEEIGINKSLGRGKYNKLIKLLISGIILSPKKSKNYISNNWSKNQAVEEVLKIIGYYNEHDIYRSLDWLNANQLKIEKELWNKKNNFEDTKLFLYDITSSYVEGDKIALTEYGYNRDCKKGKKQIVIGLLTDITGEPVSVEVFKGATRDFKTVKSQIKKLKTDFKIQEVIFIGDRGMIKQEQIKNITGENWSYITALTKPQIEKLLNNKSIQLGLFDKKLCEIEIEGDRLILRKNPIRAEEIKKNLNSKIEYLKKKIIKKNEYLSVSQKRSVDVGLKELNNIIQKLKLTKIIDLKSDNQKIEMKINEEEKTEQLKLAGCYIIKTNVKKNILNKEIVYERYKDLAKVENDFKNLKTGFLEIRPIFVRNEAHVRGHVFACMLALKVIRYIEIKLRKLNFQMEYVWECLNNIQYIINTFKGHSYKTLPSELNEDSSLILKTLNIEFPVKL